MTSNAMVPVRETQDLDTYSQAPDTSLAQRRALMPSNYTEAFQMADAMGRSGLFGVKTAEQAVVILMTGMEMGLAPAQAMRGIYVVQNRPSPSADTLMAVCLSHPSVCKFFVPLHSDSDHATYSTLRAGAPQPTEYSFTMDMARRAGLDKKETWRQHPESMLRARCIAHLARMIYPDLTLGLYVPDEAEEIPARESSYQPPAPARQVQPLEDTRVTRDGTARDERTPAENRAPAAQRPPAPNQQSSNPPGTFACAGCGRALTKAQNELSVRNYGESLCPGCQKNKVERPANEAASQSVAEPTAVLTADDLQAKRRAAAAPLIALMEALPKARLDFYRAGWDTRYGTANPKNLEFEAIDTEIRRIIADNDEANTDAGDDPFDDSNGFQSGGRARMEEDVHRQDSAERQGALLAVAGKGHESS